MLKNTPKILSALFLLVFALQLVLVVGFAFYPAETQATTFDPQVDIGAGVSEIGANSIGQYIKAIYNYAIGVVGILATVVMMIGGIVWITAGGNQTRISEAKAWIGASLTGLVLALASYTILSMINRDLVEFQPIDVKEIEKNTTICCQYDSSCRMSTPDTCLKGTPSGNVEGSNFFCDANSGQCKKSAAEGEGCNNSIPCEEGLVCKMDKCYNEDEAQCIGPGVSLGSPCSTSNVPKGYCQYGKCLPCKTTNTPCRGAALYNHECCSGDCLWVVGGEDICS